MTTSYLALEQSPLTHARSGRLSSDRLSSEPLSSDFLQFELERDPRVSPAPSRSSSAVLSTWLKTQSVNVSRHVGALQPFRDGEFGTGPESPSRAHVQAVNHMMRSLRKELETLACRVSNSASLAVQDPRAPQFHRLLQQKDKGSEWVKRIEKIWDFYFEIFGQRRSRVGPLLLGADRVALDCYQVIYTHLGVAKSIPTPGPFSYMETGFSPATFRRGIPLSKLGKQINPFPLIQLPYHRLVNPWTLGAILHEVSHDLQTDLAMREVVPRAIAYRLKKAGMSPLVVSTWTGWHSEAWADLCGMLLGGPVMVESLMDIAARSPQSTLGFVSGRPHPTPYLRLFMNTELLCRMGFQRQAQIYNQLWQRLYPNPTAGTIPAELLATFVQANRLVVDTVCFTRYKALGDRTLAEATGSFSGKHQQMIAEAGRRLAQGNDPGIIPERFLIGASRYALNHRLADANNITQNFYRALGRR
ncbi:MAG: hypothetical protein AAFV90_23925 [Cyanobacteria bacterium J06634_5]